MKLIALIVFSFSLNAYSVNYSTCLKQIGIEENGATISSEGEIKMANGFSRQSLIEKEKTIKRTKGNEVIEEKKIKSSLIHVNNDKTQSESLILNVDQDGAKIHTLITGEEEISAKTLMDKKRFMAENALEKLLEGEEASFPKKVNGAWTKENLKVSDKDLKAIYDFRAKHNKYNKNKHPREVALVKDWAKQIEKMPLEFKAGVYAEFEFDQNNNCYLKRKATRLYKDGELILVDELNKSVCEKAVIDFDKCNKDRKECKANEEIKGQIAQLANAQNLESGLGGESEAYKDLYNLSYLCKQNFRLFKETSGRPVPESNAVKKR